MTENLESLSDEAQKSLEMLTRRFLGGYIEGCLNDMKGEVQELTEKARKTIDLVMDAQRDEIRQIMGEQTEQIQEEEEKIAKELSEYKELFTQYREEEFKTLKNQVNEHAQLLKSYIQNWKRLRTLFFIVLGISLLLDIFILILLLI